MNRQQLRRWKQLSTGLAKFAWTDMTKKRRKKVVAEVKGFIDYLSEAYPLKDISDWDCNAGSVYVGDNLTEFLSEHTHYNMSTGEEKGNKFKAQVSSCIRAGFDVAVTPSTGVVGFTVGDIRSAFKNSIPQWVAKFFDPPLNSGDSAEECLWL